ncbi:hypothetical protein [Legionella spiritensis]|uniref:hypothetical protein n=1 Tax=Legionella spiritensis TaxID=452 RepID=UPI0012E33388|nr:hypothetical protein [Legionella spiritensis]
MEIRPSPMKCAMHVQISAYILIFPGGYVTGGFLKDYFINIQALMIEHQTALKQYDGRY